MSITARCRCGKKYQVKNSAAGKKFKCTECGVPVTVPEEQLDDLDDYEDEDEEDFDDGEIQMPVRRKKKKSSKAMSMTSGILSEVAIDVPKNLGLLVGAIGYTAGMGCFLIGALGLLIANPIVLIGGIVLAFLFFLGAGAASGKGMKVSRDFVWEGTGSIMAGIVVVITPILLGGIAYLIYTTQ